MSILRLIRGLPGSGKTTLAKNMEGFYHVEADMFFVQTNGKYVFSPQKLGIAHDWCQLKAAQALERGENVVVSNTFVKKWELQPYLKMAEKLGADVEIITAKGEFKNEHNVPDAVLQRMRASWEEL